MVAKFEGLSIVWLEAFVAVAESRKRTAAAARLGITQGTITKHVQHLERWLGRVLVFDGSSPARLTPDGDDFLPVARQILELLDNARRSVVIAAEMPPETRASAKHLKPPSRDRT